MREFVKAGTGFPISGVSPVAHATAPITLIDRELFRFRRDLGRREYPHGVFQLRPQDLEALTGAPVTRRGAGMSAAKCWLIAFPDGAAGQLTRVRRPVAVALRVVLPWRRPQPLRGASAPWTTYAPGRRRANGQRRAIWARGPDSRAGLALPEELE